MKPFTLEQVLNSMGGESKPEEVSPVAILARHPRWVSITEDVMFKVICAWCKKRLKGREDADHTSHGICRTCADREMKKLHTLCRTTQNLEHDTDIGGERGGHA